MVFEHVSRKQAFLTHLSVSLTIFFVLFYFMLFVWFPSFYYTLDDGYRGTAIIFFVDVVLGPGLTLLVFKKSKPVSELKRDMAVIILFQLVALSWGVKSVYEDRPLTTVFYEGRFLVITQTVGNGVDAEKINNGKSGGQKLAYLEAPRDLSEKGDFMMEAYQHGVSSEYHYGSLYEPISDENVNDIIEYRFDMDALEQESSANSDILNKYIDKNPGYLEKYFFYAIKGRFNSGIAVFDPVAIRIIDIIDVKTHVLAERPEMNLEPNNFVEEVRTKE